MLSKFAPGQVWKYQNRDSESDSRIIVVRVDDDPEYGNIVHVFVNNLQLANSAAPDRVIRFINHMPFVEDALEKSVLELESEVESLPDYEDGYQLWRTAFEQSDAGVFDVSVVEGIEMLQETLQ